MRARIPRLSKSRFMSGLQCRKRLYLELFAPELVPETDPVTQAKFDTGHEVGDLARRRFRNGRLIAHDHKHHGAAEKYTRKLLTDPSVTALYEAAFRHDNVFVRTDVLVRQGSEEFDLIEVKSTARWKEPHLYDLAVQLYVLEGTGLRIGRTSLMHLNRDYVHQGGEYDLEQLFVCADLTEPVRQLQPTVVTALAALRETLRGDEPPPIPIGPHCTSPYTCPFYGHCNRDGPEHPVEELPSAGRRLLGELADLGVSHIAAIPADFTGLSALQGRVRDAVQSGNRHHDPAIAGVLATVRFPVHFLDFETFGPALPVFPGTRPFETLPFQWSDHILSRDGQVQHREFLHDGSADPRRAFAESLLAATGDRGSVIVYSSYEAGRLRELEASLPDLAPRLARLRERLFDLLPVIRAHVYDPAFHGSFSIKAVLPALVPHLGYDDLTIGDGQLASLAYQEMRHPRTAPARATGLRDHLLAYCKRDTEAMLELFKTLR